MLFWVGLEGIKVISSNFLKKIKSTQFYELRIKSGNEYRIIFSAIDNLNFSECTKAVCLFGFQKKSTKDYKKAIKKAESILINYLKVEFNVLILKVEVL
ncbi:MAG: type II toxin-antitoxin system RelE/ParE family toxin [Flavobacteriaceae bacterium]|nr:type II toxin-antitoxin system RelE/ParE family toxin [Flavobacteriaceae bacterium]